MIELRWLEYFVLLDAERGFGTTKNKLQYRQMVNVLELGIQEPIWSEWLDVPTVREE